MTVAFELPTEGTSPKTYRVTLAAARKDNPDWIVSTFAAGKVCHVTFANKGRFEVVWDGLDDNFMPVPPGDYVIRGIYMPAEKWAIDDAYHTIIPEYIAGLGDSWSPAKGEGHKAPWIAGHQFGIMQDMHVHEDGKASFWAGYIESWRNPFLADLNRPIDHDQVLQSWTSGARAGGLATATDGMNVWCSCNNGGTFLFRGDGNWGDGRTGWGVRGVMTEELANDLDVLVRDGQSTLLYASYDGDVDNVCVYDGNSAVLLDQASLKDPIALMMDHTGASPRLLGVHKISDDQFAVVAMDLNDGRFAGKWTPHLTLPQGLIVSDADIGTDGAIYVTCPDQNRVFKIGTDGGILHALGQENTFTPGDYNDQVFYRPSRISVWRKSGEAQDRVLVVEYQGPGRTSEWTADGQLLRQWFLCPVGSRGYIPDPANPSHVYLTNTYTHGLIRWKVDYDTGEWTVDSFYPDQAWPEEVRGFGQWPKIVETNGNRYLVYVGGKYAIYRWDGQTWVASAARIEKEGQKYYWHDANNDNQVQPEEYLDNPAGKYLGGWWGDGVLDDLSLTNRPGNLQREVYRLQPRSFDEHGNPIYHDDDWKMMIEDPVFKAKAAKESVGALYGDNEIGYAFWDWGEMDGSDEEGWFLHSPSIPENTGGIDTAGAFHAQWKLTRYDPDGQGGYNATWRVGRKAFRLASPGEVYGPMHLTGPHHGMVGVNDQNGLYHVYTVDGLYVDTLMQDDFRVGKHFNNMYSHAGEFWYGRTGLNKNDGKVYLYMGRSAASVYECRNWQPGVIQPIEVATPEVTLTAADIASPNEIALKLRGGAGAAKVASAVYTPRRPALDGSLEGWEQASPVIFGLDDQRKVEARLMFGQRQLYLRWHVRTGNPVAFVKDGADLTRIFTHDREADTCSFYLQGDPQTQPGRDRGRAGDVRFAFALLKQGEIIEPVCLGMYPQYDQSDAEPMTYISPVRTAEFGHVAPVEQAKLGYQLDEDGKGFVIAASIPVSAVPMRDYFSIGLRTTGNFAVTLGGATNFWWANTGGITNTYTTDEPSEAMLYPGSWAPVTFEKPE